LSLVVLGKALAELAVQISLPNLVAFLVTLAMSVTIMYALLLLLVSAVF
jgi:hypothetical protein